MTQPRNDQPLPHAAAFQTSQTSSLMSPPTAPPTPPPLSATPPGWYPHPDGTDRWAWWTGYAWVDTPGSSIGPGAGPTSGRTWFPDLTPLRFPAALLGTTTAFGLLVMNLAAGYGSDAVAQGIGLFSLVFSIVGFPLTAWYAAQRWGSGSWIRDFQLKPKLPDPLLGIAGTIGLMITTITMGILAGVLRLPQGSNLNVFEAQVRDDPGIRVAMFIVMFVLAGVVAPITEELLFRGAILRGLLDRMKVWPAIVVQGVLFGLLHFTPSEGWGNVSMMFVLAPLGIGLGAITRLTGRLTPAILAHAGFNCLQLTLLWVTLDL